MASWAAKARSISSGEGGEAAAELDCGGARGRGMRASAAASQPPTCCRKRRGAGCGGTRGCRSGGWLRDEMMVRREEGCFMGAAYLGGPAMSKLAYARCCASRCSAGHFRCAVRRTVPGGVDRIPGASGGRRVQEVRECGASGAGIHGPRRLCPVRVSKTHGFNHCRTGRQVGIVAQPCRSAGIVGNTKPVLDGHGQRWRDAHAGHGSGQTASRRIAHDAAQQYGGAAGTRAHLRIQQRCRSFRDRNLDVLVAQGPVAAQSPVDGGA